MVSLKFKRLRPDAILPRYATEGAAGLDICFCADEFRSLKPGGWGIFATGLAVEIPLGWELQCRPRSGLAGNYGLTVLNSPGTIDSDYRGELKVILINHGPSSFAIKPGDRIAQLVLAQVPQASIEEVYELSSTERGEGGFGSTGA
jgi:dUTP pyrophosphatase